MALRPTRRCSTCGKVTAMWHLHTCSPVTAPTPERRMSTRKFLRWMVGFVLGGTVLGLALAWVTK